MGKSIRQSTLVNALTLTSQSELEAAHNEHGFNDIPSYFRPNSINGILC